MAIGAIRKTALLAMTLGLVGCNVAGLAVSGGLSGSPGMAAPRYCFDTHYEIAYVLDGRSQCLAGDREITKAQHEAIRPRSAGPAPTPVAAPTTPPAASGSGAPSAYCLDPALHVVYPRFGGDGCFSTDVAITKPEYDRRKANQTEEPSAVTYCYDARSDLRYTQPRGQTCLPSDYPISQAEHDRPGRPASVPAQAKVAAGPAVAPRPVSGTAFPAAVGAPSASLSARELYRKAKDSVWLVIAVESIEDLERGKVAQGSAVAISDTRLLTNCHVIEGMNLIGLRQDDAVKLARVVRSLPGDRCILEAPEGGLTPVPALRDYASLEIGETVYTIGNPSGLERTLGNGLISGLRDYDGVRMVQTTAPISPGSSGGGLFDEGGRLIAITTLIIVGADKTNQALNFAIAAEEFR